MDEQTSNSTESNSSQGKKFIIPAVVAGVIILAVVGVFAYQGMKSPTENLQATPTEIVSETPTPTSVPEAMNEISSESGSVVAYKDGTYEATGNYVSPGGPRDVDVTITLKGGVVTASTFQGHATDPNSMRFQGEFAEGYKAVVVGKPIDEIAVVKVSGSSLTPKGFMDALEKIKTEAKS